MRITIVPLLLALFSVPVLAQVDSRPMPEAERQQKLERARSLNAEASSMKKEADARQKAANEVCYKKFLVSSCLEDAAKTHTQSVREAKRKELEAGELERDVKRRDMAVKDTKKAVEAPKREADQKAQGEAYRAEEAQRAEERAAKLAKKEQQAADGRRKHAAAQEKHKKKLEDQAKKEAKAAEKRRAREAKAAAKAAAKPADAAAGAAPANP
jgi:lipopolysaccharide export LptBFGC system permease protein LptF